MRKKIADLTDDELNLWMMGSSSRKKIYKLRLRVKRCNEKSAADRKAVESLLTRIVKLKAKEAKSVKSAEARLIARKQRIAHALDEKARAKKIKDELRASIRAEKLREKHFTNRTSFRHVVSSMVDAQPNEIYRYHLGLCSFVHLTKSLRALGAPLEGDFRRPSFHMNDCQVFLKGNWTTIPIRGIEGEQAYVPVAPVTPVAPENAAPVVEETGPISFTERTTHEELMSGRVVVKTLRERSPREYKNDYSVKKMDHDNLFYAIRRGQWTLIPGQAGSSPTEQQSKVYASQQGYGADAPATTAWIPPASVESETVEQPQTRAERIARIAELQREVAELKAAALEAASKGAKE